MIEQVDDVLTTWVKSLPGGRNPNFQLPPQPEGELTVYCYLLEVCDDAQRHNAGLPNIQPSLRYLVTTSGSDTVEAHKVLGELLKAALEKPYFELAPNVRQDFEVEFEPAGSPVWAALRIPPRPAFVIRVPLVRPEPPVRGYRVETVKVDVHELAWLYGRVVTLVDKVPVPDAHGRVVTPVEKVPVPVAHARVDFVELKLSTQTDDSGLFAIPNVPVPEVEGKKREPPHITITAHGYSETFEWKKTGTKEAPEVYKLNIPDLPEPPKGENAG